MKKKKRYMAAAGVLSWLICAKLVMAAVFDESKAVPYQDYAASHTIEDATLFIGTYLIHAQAMTDELYEKAMESAADSNQTNIYYKSELASGAWIDITDAGGLSDIAGQGILVEESELAELWVSCCTGSDGTVSRSISFRIRRRMICMICRNWSRSGCSLPISSLRTVPG